MSLQGCLARRKDCSGGGRPLTLPEVLDICKSTQQAAPSRPLYIVLPGGKEYRGGIYKYEEEELSFISDKEKTPYCMELYPELIQKDSLELKDLIDVGLIWQYLSLKVESIGLGVSQRARAPKKINKLINRVTSKDFIFLYSVAVRERDRKGLIMDTSEPLQKKQVEGIHLLDTPSCYKNRAIYENRYEGIPLDASIFNRLEKKPPDHSSLYELSQLLWACQGETDHATHGNRDPLEKNGYGRVHASGCAGYSVYPVVIVEDLASLPKGAYIYNPVGYSGLNRWIKVNEKITYDHFIQEYTLNFSKGEIEKEFGINFTNYAILLCIDRKKPCAGFMHRVMNLKYWAEIEAGMALAGLQLQANALGLKWQKVIISNPDDPDYRSMFNLDSAEQLINKMANNLVNLAKSERLSLKGSIVPISIFFLE